MTYPPNYTIKKYKPRELTEQQLVFCEAYLAGETQTYSAVLAGYKSPKRAGSSLLMCKRIITYLDKRQSQLSKVPITFEDKAERLMHVVSEAIPLNSELTKQVDTGIKAIAELNKMQGHYAPAQVQTVQVDATLEDIRNARQQYKQDK